MIWIHLVIWDDDPIRHIYMFGLNSQTRLAHLFLGEWLFHQHHAVHHNIWCGFKATFSSGSLALSCRKQRSCSERRSPASSDGMERWWEICSAGSECWVGHHLVSCSFLVPGHRAGSQLRRQAACQKSADRQVLIKLVGSNKCSHGCVMMRVWLWFVSGVVHHERLQTDRTWCVKTQTWAGEHER